MAYFKVSQSPLFKIMNDYLVVKSVGEIKEKNIFVPLKNAYDSHREWADKVNIVFEVADNIKDIIGVGQRILLKTHAKLQRIDETTKIVSERTGTAVTVDVTDTEGKVVDKEDIEKYFFVKLEDVLCVIN